MEKKAARFIFQNGEIIPFGEAKIHPLNTAMKYASSIYDAWRGYWNPEHGELYLFRLREHLERLGQSAKIVQIQCPYSIEEMLASHLALIRANKLREDIHCRIILYVDAPDGGLYSNTPIGAVMAASPMGRYFKEESQGLHCRVSSWRRISDEDMPPASRLQPTITTAVWQGWRQSKTGTTTPSCWTGMARSPKGPATPSFSSGMESP